MMPVKKISSPAAIAIIAVVVLAIILLIFFLGKKIGKGKLPKEVDLPPGVDIPTGWTPRPVSSALYDALSGPGADADEMEDSLQGLNAAQLALVYNDFSRLVAERGKEGDLFGWIDDQWAVSMSAQEKKRIKNYFNGIV